MKRKKETSSGRKKAILLTLLIFALTFISLIINNQIREILPSKEFMPFISIEVVFNEGASFGILGSYPNLVLILSLLIVAGLTFYLFYLIFHESSKNTSLVNIISLCLMISGGLSNLIERIIYGNVVDYFRIGAWPNFNIADSLISIGVALLIFSVIKEEKGMKKNR
ncbi:MAG: signal peptidase [Candidatus Woesearchaeota archaeon]|nr:signal peptidase [Candidatus Woesearchaeota archaeon]